MNKETITVNIDKEIAAKLRKFAIEENAGKGFLGQTISKALEEYLAEKKKEEIKRKFLARLLKGYNLGGLRYKKREELYDRKL